MKYLIVTLLVTIFAANAQALSTVPEGGLIPASIEIELDEATQVLVLDMKTVNGVSCPGQLELKVSSIQKGELVISYDNSENEVLFDMMGRVSKTCGEEIFKVINDGSQFVCLSYGFEKGTVMIDLRNLSSDIEVLKVRMPVSLEAEAVTQL